MAGYSRLWAVAMMSVSSLVKSGLKRNLENIGVGSEPAPAVKESWNKQIGWVYERCLGSLKSPSLVFTICPPFSRLLQNSAYLGSGKVSSSSVIQIHTDKQMTCCLLHEVSWPMATKF